MANHDVSQHLQGCQGQVGGPQVPVLGHGNEIKSLIIGHVGTVGHEMSILKELGTSDVCKPLGYVAHDTST